MRLVFVPVAIALAAWGLGLALALSACGTDELHFHKADAGSDAGSDAGTDPGCTCVRWGVKWKSPVWLWVGQDDGLLGSGMGVPLCPKDYGGGEEAYHGHGGLVAPLECGACVCQAPTGECILPSTLTAHDVICQNLGQPHKDIPFDAPTPWDGKCAQTDPIDAGAGVKSVSIEPITIKENCEVGPPVPERAVYPVSAYWHQYALGCHGRRWDDCGDKEREICVPLDEAPSPEWKLCILQEGETGDDCPDEWPDKHVFYGDKLIDHRGCTDCTCGPPVGSMCTSFFSIYQDTACSGQVVLGQAPVSSTSPGPCDDLPGPGQPMGSKAATPPTYIPGKCDPMGGDLFIDGGVDGGAVETTSPTTFCCKR